MLDTVTDLWEKETFLIFDLEALSISNTNILLAPRIATELAPNQNVILQKAYSAFDELVTSGNRIAKLMRSESQQLDQLLATVSQNDRPMSSDKTDAPTRADASVMHNSLPPVDPELAHGELVEALPGDVFGGDGFGGIHSSEQTMDLANAINMDHAEWMLQATRSPNM